MISTSLTFSFLLIVVLQCCNNRASLSRLAEMGLQAGVEECWCFWWGMWPCSPVASLSKWRKHSVNHPYQERDAHGKVCSPLVSHSISWQTSQPHNCGNGWTGRKTLSSAKPLVKWIALRRRELPGALVVFQGCRGRSELLPGDFFVALAPRTQDSHYYGRCTEKQRDSASSCKE